MCSSHVTFYNKADKYLKYLILNIRRWIGLFTIKFFQEQEFELLVSFLGSLGINE